MRTRRDFAPLTERETIARYFYMSNGVLLSDQPIYYINYYPYKKETVDEVHKNYPHEGGPFSSRMTSIAFKDGPIKQGYESVSTVYPYARSAQFQYGAFRVFGDSASSLPPSGDATAASYGSRAWNRFKPGKPVVSLGQFFAELRDTPFTIMKTLKWFKHLKKTSNRIGLKRGVTTTNPLSAGGGAYLSWEFGWKPFLRDLTAWLDSIQKLDEQIAQLKRDNGRRMRRGGTLFHTNTSDTVSAAAPIFGCRPTYYTINSCKKTTVTDERVWFCGSFRYYISGLDNPKWGKFKAIRKLWGLEPTPELVYELLPFSWLVDWFADFGSLVSNLVSQVNDNLVAQYAYLMRRHEIKIITDCCVSSKLDTTVKTGPDRYTTTTTWTPSWATSTYSQVTKTRVVASPFGFGLDLGALTDYQVAILSALGLSRLRF